MFLKRVKLFIQKLSIATRLTLLYSLTTFILLLFVTTFLNFAMLHLVYTSGYQLLSGEITTLKHLLHAPTNQTSLAEEVNEPRSGFGEPLFYYHIRIFDNNQDLLIETKAIDPALRQLDFFKNTQVLVPNVETHAKWISPQNKIYLLMQLKTDSAVPQQSSVIQVALDISSQMHKVAQYRNQLIIALILGTLLAIALGYFVARNGLKALSNLTETAKKMTADSLHRRIEPQLWPPELINLSMAFNQMLDRIEFSFANLTEFSADLAHELRTPVNNLMLEIEVSLAETCSIEHYQKILASNLEELHHLNQIIENILFLTKTKNATTSIDVENIKVEQEIEKVCDYHQAMADEKNIALICQGHATVQFNRVMFRRLISNLLSNALKYSLTGSQITFDTKTLNNGFVEITLTDQGVGIAEEHLPKVFNRFYRINPVDEQSAGGTGLGLSIVKSIVDLHHGEISIASQLGKGTTIVLLLRKTTLLS